MIGLLSERVTQTNCCVRIDHIHSSAVFSGMHSGCLRSQVQRAFADTAYRERRPLRPQQVRWAGRAWTCRTCFNSAVPGQPYRSSRPQQTQLHAFRRPPSSSSNEPSFSHSSIVDITAEPATTSDRDSDDDRSPQHRPNIIWRALAAGMGILQAAFQWMRTHLKPWKLFDRRFLLYVTYCLMAFTVMTFARVGLNAVTTRPPQEVPYSDFLTLVHSGNVKTAGIDDSSDKIYFSLNGHSSQQAAEAATAEAAAPVEAAAAEAAPTQTAAATASSQAQAVASTIDSSSEVAEVILRGAAASKPRKAFYTRSIADPGLIPLLIASGVTFGAIQASLSESLGRMVVGTCALWLPCLPLFWLMRRALNNRTNTKPKKSGDSKSAPITFADVAGVDTAREELLEVVACLRDARRYSRLNAKTPSGVLLCGPPGTGKTLLAKAVAGEAGVPFFAASASEFVELFVGRGAARVRELFAEAKKKAPCVIFIDELDAVGSRRGIGVNEERDQTLNQLLTELDGFEGREGVLLLAATNRAEVLDPALTRPGRLSRRVVVPLPDETGRADILAVHLRNTPMLSEADKEFCTRQIARVSRGFSGAELANVVNEAALLAGRQGQQAVTLPDLVEAVQRTKYGVNGGRSLLVPSQGLQRQITDWLVKRLSSSKQVKASPVGQ